MATAVQTPLWDNTALSTKRSDFIFRKMPTEKSRICPNHWLVLKNTHLSLCCNYGLWRKDISRKVHSLKWTNLKYILIRQHLDMEYDWICFFFKFTTRFCARSYEQLVNDCIPHMYFKLLTIDVSSFLGLFP